MARRYRHIQQYEKELLGLNEKGQDKRKLSRPY